MTTEEWRRAGDLIRERRGELGLTQEQLAAKAPVGTATIRLLEKGGRDRYQASTLGAVSRALEWPANGIRRLVEGADAADLVVALDRPPLEIIRDRIRDELAEGRIGRASVIRRAQALEEDLMRYWELVSFDGRERIVHFAGKVVDEETQDWVDTYGVPGDPDEAPDDEDLPAAAESSDPSGAREAADRPIDAPPEQE